MESGMKENKVKYTYPKNYLPMYLLYFFKGSVQLTLRWVKALHFTFITGTLRNLQNML